MASRAANAHRPRGLPSTGTGWWVFDFHPNPTPIDEPVDTMEIVDSGKWMLFYPKSDMDAKWQEACEHMRNGRFGVVQHMKVSTFRENPRSSDHNKGVIILYTPRANKEVVMESGRRIMEIMEYDVTMYFKTNEQTHAGTAATGQSINHTLYLRPQIRYQDVFADESFP